MAEFKFPYLMMSVTATLDDALRVKQGFRTLVAPMESIRHFAVKRHGNGSTQFDELIVAYQKDTGKNGLIRTFSNADDLQFKAMVEALAQARPTADLRKLPVGEALKTMGAVDTERAAMIGVPLALLAITGIFTSPFLVHGLDQGHAELDVSALAKGQRLDTRNLVLTGALDAERYLEVTHTKNGTKTSATYYLPLVPEGGTAADEVPVVLQTRELSERQLLALIDQGRWPCTLRNFFWEGLESGHREYFHDQLKVNVTANTLLCELADPSGPPDLALFGLIMGVVLLVLGIAAVAIVRKRSRA